MDEKLRFKTVETEDIDFLKEMLFEAVYWRSLGQGSAPSFESGLNAEGVLTSVLEWGTGRGDFGIIAIRDSHKIGAVWIRLYEQNKSIRGFIDETIPVLVIGIKQGYRKNGVGTELLQVLFREAMAKGIESISLMVSEDNNALSLYKKVGFEIIKKVDDSFLMLKNLQS